jgi:hypothetical protein
MRATTIFRPFNAKKLTSGCLLFLAGTLLAQEPEPILDRPSRLSDPAPMLPMTPSPVLDTMTLFPDVTQTPSLEESIGKSPWKFVLHGTATATYDDNIFISHDNKQEDFIFTIAPGVAVGLGDFKEELKNLGSYEDRFAQDRSDLTPETNYIFVHAVPSVTLFADNSNEDSFNYDITLDGQYEWKRLTLGIKARVMTLNLPDVDLGTRVERTLFSGALTSKYDLSPKTSFELNFYNYIRDFSGDHVDSVEYRGQAWFNYQVKPKISLGLGFSYGQVDLSEGPSQNYEQVVARIRYRATEKVRFDLVGGVDFREISGFANPTTGIFSLGLTYNPFDGTSIYLQGYSRTVASASNPPSNYTVTGVDLQIRQRFARRFYFVLAVGFQNADYDYFGTDNTRTDNIFTIHPSIGMDVTNWLSCELGMTYRNDDSTSVTNDFSETTVYVQVNVYF